MGAKKDPKAGAKAPKKKEGGGGKAKKKKWSKGKSRDKLNNLVLFDQVNINQSIVIWDDDIYWAINMNIHDYFNDRPEANLNQ